MEQDSNDAHMHNKRSDSISYSNIRCFRKLGLWSILRIKLVHVRGGGIHLGKSHHSKRNVILAAIWGHSWQEKIVQVECDNMAVVSIINHGSPKNKEAIHLARCLAFIAGKFDFHMEAVHIKGANNILADVLSQNNLLLFQSLYP